MTTTLQSLARWARDLSPEAVPPRVAERVRLQHLAIAGSVREAAGWRGARALAMGAGARGAARLVGGGRATRREAVRLHAALAALVEQDDWLLHGHTGAAAVPAAWAWSRGQEVEAVVRATVAANEVAGRLGAAMLLGPGGERGQGAIASLAAATAAGLLSGLDGAELEHALALACVAPRRAGWRDLMGGEGGGALGLAEAALQGLEAVELARAGMKGPLDVLEAPGGLLESSTPAPLRAAFTGLGRAWLSQTLAFAVLPASITLQVPLQAVQEILHRHVKAADKRLRWDQVDRIEIGLGAPAWRVHQVARGQPAAPPLGDAWRLPEAVGRLVATHELSVGDLVAEPVESHRDAIAEIARRVVVHHSWARTADLAQHLVTVLGPLLAGITAGELREAGRAWTAAGAGPLPRPGLGDALLLARTHPGQMLERLQYQSGDLADARLEELQLRLGADVRLFTTRGGSWPERRDLAIGSPGWPWEDTVARVLRRWSPTGDLGPARALLEGTGSAEAWVEALLPG